MEICENNGVAQGENATKGTVQEELLEEACRM